MRRLTLVGSALALGFIICTSVTASACSWRGSSGCVTEDDYDQPVYRAYPRQAYDYYVIVPNGYGGGYRLLRTLHPPRAGLFPPTVYYYGRRPAYHYAPSYRRRYHDYDYDERW